MITDIWADITTILFQYRCHSSSPDNCKTIKDELKAYIDRLMAANRIHDGHVVCDHTYNGQQWNIYPQIVTALVTISITSTDKFTFFVNLTPKGAAIFPQWDGKLNKDDYIIDDIPQDEDPDDAYDRAMGIIK